jgi:hypothetical protein
MDWSWLAWGVTCSAVVVSGVVAAFEGTLRRRPGLDLGFVDHGGMWSDLLLLSCVNAVTVPHLSALGWPSLVGCAAAALVLAVAAHARWYRGAPGGSPWREHLWPARPHGTWARDLSAAGWMHVVYMTGQLGVILAGAMTPAPSATVWLVSILLSAHLPIGLLLPSRVVTGRWHARGSRALLVAGLVAIWVVAAVKL